MTTPVIVIGMHRSGTSLVARALHSSGVNMGLRQSPNAESLAFRRLNEQLLAATGGSWFEVDPARAAVQLGASRRGLVDRAAAALERTRRRHGVAEPWGFKDPRTTLLIPVWAEVFAEARWIYLLRNGIDVALSLNRRAQQQAASPRKRFFGRYFFSADLLSPQACLQLWADYVDAYQKDVTAIAPDQLLEVRYEDLLTDAEGELRRILRHAGASEAIIPELAAAIAPPDHPAIDAGLLQQLGSHPKLAELGYEIK